MNAYIVTISFKNEILTREYQAYYSLDAANTALDDLMDDLINEKGDFKLTCKLKED